MNTKFITIFALAVSTAAALAQTSSMPAIIPAPEKIKMEEGVFSLGPKTVIIADPSAHETGEMLAARLRTSAGFPINVDTRAEHASAVKDAILFTTIGAAADLGAEGYELSVSPHVVVIRAPGPAGLFYGMQTLLQLLPPQIFSSNAVSSVDWNIPCVQIEDRPRFKWRGLMLDVSRHFFTKPEVEHLLDEMAMHKLNTFHWHLVDDQGWRIEIKKYPKLTQIGAWRSTSGFGLDPKASTAYGPDGRYGGFYTQDDIREVVKYAAARHITIVPEIEMPGHSSAALSAYPQFSCTGGPFESPLVGGVFDGIYCAGNDDAFKFVEDVLTEVFQLFPGKYIHIGGDEVPTTNWVNCAKCQARMKAEGLRQPGELEGYFIRRIEKFVNASGRTLIGWSEIRTGGLAPNAAIMDWVGGAVEAAGAGHDVVMSPLADCYFDHYQSTNHATEPHAIGGYLPLQQVYEFEPVPRQIAPGDQAHILGAQANVWTEYMPNFHHVEYMIFPRACALAEVDWSPATKRNFQDFEQRMQVQCARLDESGINYRRPEIAVQSASSGK
jgi:hexosaminidase